MQPFDYLNTTAGMIWTAICVIMGFALTALGYLMLNKIPASWLCDYNETPSEELLSGKRFSYLRSGIPISLAMSVCLVLCRLQFNKGFDIYFILLSLIVFTCVMIAVSDFKYQIIPDQFTIAIGVLALAVSVYDLVRGYNILHFAWWSPLAGAGIGAAVMLLIDFIGMLVYHRDGMGFGDVKLFFAVGILTGFPGTIYAFIISVITATVCFIAIIIVSKIINGKKEEIRDDTDAAEEKRETAESAEPKSSGSDETEPEEEHSEDSGNEETVPEKEHSEDSGSEETVPEEEDSEDDVNGEVGFGSYLAFGPYIAIAVGVYCVLFDFVQYLAGLYLNLFK